MSAPAELRRLRRQRLVRRLCWLGGRPTFEFIDQLARDAKEVVDRLFDRYAALDPETLHVVGGDQFPPAPIRLVEGGR